LEQALVFHLQADISDESLADQYQGIVKPLKLYISENIKRMQKIIQVDIKKLEAGMNTVQTTKT
jgi:hypothetical protein